MEPGGAATRAAEGQRAKELPEISRKRTTWLPQVTDLR
jgi:hypothetical protein